MSLPFFLFLLQSSLFCHCYHLHRARSRKRSECETCETGSGNGLRRGSPVLDRRVSKAGPTSVRADLTSFIACDPSVTLTKQASRFVSRQQRYSVCGLIIFERPRSRRSTGTKLLSAIVSPGDPGLIVADDASGEPLLRHPFSLRAWKKGGIYLTRPCFLTRSQ